MWFQTLTGLLLLAAPPQAPGPEPEQSGPTPTSEPTALIDLGSGRYQGFEGGLYPAGSNHPPAPYLEAALQRARRITPRAADGSPDPERGLIVVLCVGPSTTAHEFAAFERLEDPSPERNPRIIFINGAQAAQIADRVVRPGGFYWGLVLERLEAAGVTPAQVQVVWFNQINAPGKPADEEGVVNAKELRRLRKEAEAQPSSFPEHTEALTDQLESIVGVLDQMFAHLELCYVSDHPYSGFGEPSRIFTEPRIFESGFAVKWLIEAAIESRAAAAPGTDSGPLLLWGPYFWAPPAGPNSQGTAWVPEDFELEDPGHPSASGERKSAELLRSFFRTDPTAVDWYLDASSPPVQVVASDRDAFVTKDQRGANFGTETRLQIGASAGDIAYVHFDLSQVERPVLHAKLSVRNHTDHGSYLNWKVHRVDDDWGETTITARNAPDLGELLGIFPRTSRDSTRALDLTEVVNGLPESGSLSIAIVSSARDLGRAAVLSREAGQPPRLVMIPARD